MRETRMKPHRPNDSGETMCIVRWLVETPGGWLGAYEESAFAYVNAANTDWRQRMRDFLCDREQHQLPRNRWHADHDDEVVLYSMADFFVAYYDHAVELCTRADDTRPMYHIMADSDRPHRIIIHAIHLAAWVQHLASAGLPVVILRDWREE